MILAAEIALRILGVASPERSEEIFAGFRGAPPLFYKTRTAGGPTYRTSPNRLEYFNDQSFPLRKSEGTLRVVSFGGSTTYGEPWGDAGSFSRFAGEILSASGAAPRVEAINMGGRGYGSTAILELVREALRYEPDLFVLSLGHNEFREAAFHPIERAGGRNVPLWNEVLYRRSRLFVAMRAAIKRILPAPRAARPTSLASRQIAEILARPFGPDSFRFPPRLMIPPIQPAGDETRAVTDRFRQNLDAMIEIARGAGVPCILVTVVRNEAYWLVTNRSTLRPGAADQYEPRYRDLLDAVEAGRYDAALEKSRSIGEICAIDDDPYRRVLEGDLLVALGRPAEARRAYRAAWSDDPINDVIRSVARDRGVPLVDAEAAARSAAPDSILGFSVFYDELHPTPVIHRALAAAIAFEILDRNPDLVRVGSEARSRTREDRVPEPLPDLPTTTNAEVFAYSALRSLYLQDFTTASAEAESALALDPKLGKAHVYRGICAARGNDMARARDSWEALARLYPELLPARAGK